MSAVADIRAPGAAVPLDVRNILWLLAAMVFVVGPHLLRLPTWVTIFFLVVVWVYDLLDVPMMTLMLALALLWRMRRPSTPCEPVSTVAAEGLR